MSPPPSNTFSLHRSPAIHAITLASIAEKSATINFLPPCGTKAVRMSCESVSGISS